MLVIRTGKPGHGKTLNSIKEVDQKAFKEGRTVYFHNIRDLQTDKLRASWFEFDDPLKWFELPQNSIIVVDEAQGWFGKRDDRTRPPEHITRFEVMRHDGFEVHLITQDPRYLDVHLRRLCNHHIHYWRVFKSSQVIRFESEAVVEKVELKTSFKDSDKQHIKLDKKFFDVYSSSKADHHFRFNPPKKLIMALCVIFAAGFLLFRAYDRYSQASHVDQGSVASGEFPSVDKVKDSVVSIIKPASTSDSPLSPDQYIAIHTPRIPDVPSSAPIYDELTKPKTYPKLSCVMSSDPSYIERNKRRYRVVSAGDRSYMCECYTQQGTWYKTSFSFCQNAVNRGYFDHARPDRELLAKNPSPPSDRPRFDSPPSADPSPGTAVNVVPYEKERFLW